jgi:hypothetical protein
VLRIPGARSAKGVTSEAEFAPKSEALPKNSTQSEAMRGRGGATERCEESSEREAQRGLRAKRSLLRRAKPYPKTPRKARLCVEEEEQRSGARNLRSAKRKGGYERSEVCSEERSPTQKLHAKRSYAWKRRSNGAVRGIFGARSAKGVTSEAKFAPTTV